MTGPMADTPLARFDAAAARTAAAQHRTYPSAFSFASEAAKHLPAALDALAVADKRIEHLERRVRALADVATWRTPHIYDGLCPDAVEGPGVRDPECPACRALTEEADDAR